MPLSTAPAAMTATQAMLLSQQQGQVLAPPVNAIMSDILNPLAQIDPAVIRRIDAEAALSVLARANGTPARVLKSDEQVAEEDAAAAQQQQMAQVLEAAPVAAQTAKTMAEAQALSQAAPNVPRV